MFNTTKATPASAVVSMITTASAAPAPAVPGLGGAASGPRPASELRAVSRPALAKLATQLEAAEGKAKDALTIAHVADLRSEIAALLAADKKK